MTRINCVPPSELHDKHLRAEYYELPRVFGLVRKVAEKGIDPATIDAPADYTLGIGHVKFFYTRLGYCLNRQTELIVEMISRGMKPVLTDLKGLCKGIPESAFGAWEPTEAALAINRERLEIRKAEMEAKAKRPVPSISD